MQLHSKMYIYLFKWTAFFWGRLLQAFIAFLRLLLLEYWGGPEKDRNVCFVMAPYARSPRIRLANWISLGMMVTRLACMAHRLVYC